MINEDQFKYGIQKIVYAGDDIYRKADETCYVHRETGKELMRCTTFIDGAKPFGMTPNSPYWGSLAIGTACDQYVRDFFVEGADKVNYNKPIYKHLEVSAIVQLAKDVEKYNETELKPNDWVVLADRVYLYSLELGVAGEVDLIVFNPSTQEIKIIDMKTVRSPQYIPRKMDKYSRQLNTYRHMFEELSGLKVTGLEIMWIKVWYEEGSNVSKEAYHLRNDEVPMVDVMEDIAAIWQKEQGCHWTEYRKDTPKQNKVNVFADSIDTFMQRQ